MDVLGDIVGLVILFAVLIVVLSIPDHAHVPVTAVIGGVW